MDNGFNHTKQINKKIYKKPLIVYKIQSDDALSATLRIIEYFLKIETTEEIYIEDIQLIKSCFDCPKDWQLEEKNHTCKNLTKINQFNINIHLVDLCIVVGGDGTIVWANSIFESKPRPPFLTFNLGTLGYMAIYFFQNFEKVLNALFDKDTKLYVEKRSFLKGRILNQEKKCKRISYSLEFIKNRKSSEVENFDLKDSNLFEDIFALNEITIERKANDHMIKTEIYYNEEVLTTIRSNGIILASPTGSTAYSLSAAGTIVHYGVDCFILNSICPHSLSFRPIAFPRGDKLKILLSEDSKDAVVIKDGITVTNLKPNQIIEIQMSDMYVEFLLTQDSYEKKSTMWKQKIIDQLGWNNAFKNFEIDLNGDKYVEK
jgi:NAD kinase